MLTPDTPDVWSLPGRDEKIDHLRDRRFRRHGQVGVGRPADGVGGGFRGGHVSFMSLRTVSRRRPRSEVSIAV